MSTKRRNRKKNPALDSFARDFTAKHHNARLRVNPKGEMSMSDAISLLVEPYKEEASDLEAYRTLISFACLAWNMTILPAKERQRMLNKMTALAPDLESRVETLARVMELMDRKEMLFPDVKRMIVEFKVTEQGNDLHLSIASTLSEKG